ncbi:MAG: hypothetical protein NT116_06035 [Candidatus Parcubacteria bacterium]|nr:hypothetical protein [Candidatus Parcubacteria bacterium]
MKKNTKIVVSVCFISLVIILFGINLTFANPIPRDYNGPPLVILHQTHPFDKFLNVWQYLLFAIVVELFATFIFFKKQFVKNYKLALSVFIANLISYPLFYFSFQYVMEEYLPFVIMNFLWIAEVIVMFFEAAIIFLMNKSEFSYKRALFISFILNLVTIVLSLIYLYVLFRIFPIL